MLQAIKVGDTRVVANNIYRIVTLTNDKLVKFDDGAVAVGMSGDMPEWFSDIELRVYFSDDPQSYIRFFADEARDFLRQFDALTGIAETGAESDVIRYLENHNVSTTEYVEHIPVDVVDCLSDDALERLKLDLFTIKKFASKPTSVHFDEVMRRVTKQMEMRGLPKTEPVAEAVAATEMIWTADYIAAFTSDSISELTDKQLVQLEENLVMLKNSKISLVNPKQVDDLAWQVTREIVIRGLDKVTAKPETTSKVAPPETGTLRDALPFLYTGGLEKLDHVLTKIIGSDAPVNAISEAKILKQAVKREIDQRFDRLLED